jgi:malonate transporter MadL subunit
MGIIAEGWMIYGTAILAVCYLAGLFLGDWLGLLIGVKSNVGGVGLAMLLLVLVVTRARRRGEEHRLLAGARFWGGMYIPVVVAMALQLDVHKAAGAGLVAVLAALLTVASCGLLIRFMNRHEPATAAPSPQADAGIEP